MKLRSGCLMSYAADVGNRSERSMHSNRSVKKDEAHDAPRPLVETSLVGDHRESEARSFWSIPGLGKEPPGFLANETMESLIRVSVLPFAEPLAMVLGPYRPHWLLPCDNHAGTMTREPTSAAKRPTARLFPPQSQGEDAAKPPPQMRPGALSPDPGQRLPA